MSTRFKAERGFTLQGVGDYTRWASQDPADIVTFDLELESWLAKGFQGMDVAEVSGLRRERRELRL